MSCAEVVFRALLRLSQPLNLALLLCAGRRVSVSSHCLHRSVSHLSTVTVLLFFHGVINFSVTVMRFNGCVKDYTVRQAWQFTQKVARIFRTVFKFITLPPHNNYIGDEI
ncbi:MAG: hypothetical protein [Siphoviridae sp. ctdc_1]|nr:MAG: hypothetical protein [Siphoviridae sp. ctdc_1]